MSYKAKLKQAVNGSNELGITPLEVVLSSQSSSKISDTFINLFGKELEVEWPMENSMQTGKSEGLVIVPSNM